MPDFDLILQCSTVPFVLISVFAVIATVYDKVAAKLTLRRVPESALLLIAVLGGSFSMFITMLIIRHKTKHLKFMAGIPLIIAVQLMLIWLYLHSGTDQTV